MLKQSAWQGSAPRVTSGGQIHYLMWRLLDATVDISRRGALRGGERQVLNRFDRSSPMTGEAEVKYLDGDFRVVRPGAYVRCAVTGLPIPLEELKYWSVDLQEAYINPDAVLRRHFPNVKRPRST